MADEAGKPIEGSVSPKGTPQEENQKGAGQLTPEQITEMQNKITEMEKTITNKEQYIQNQDIEIKGLKEKPEPEPPKPEEPAMSKKDFFELMMEDPEKAETLLIDKVYKKMGISPDQLKNAITTQERMTKISAQQTKTAEKMKEYGLSPKDEFEKYGPAISDVLQKNPSLIDSEDGLTLAYLKVKADKGELGTKGFTAGVESGGSSPTGIEPTLSEEDKEAYHNYKLAEDGVTLKDYAKYIAKERGGK